jgi:hypothetical protein
MIKEKFRVKNSDDANYLSYGKIVGSFKIPSTTLFTYVLENNCAHLYALTEKLTRHFRLFIDLDLKKDII